jgi:sRNA-binding protein
MPKPPPPEEVAEKERQALISYSAGVAAEAKAYQEELKNQDAAKKEAKELAKMGYEEKFKPEYAPRPTIETQLAEASFLQLSEDIKVDANDDDGMFDPDAKRALDYLSQQFPTDFPPDKAPAKPVKAAPKPPTEEDEREKELKRSQAALQVA